MRHYLRLLLLGISLATATATVAANSPLSPFEPALALFQEPLLALQPQQQNQSTPDPINSPTHTHTQPASLTSSPINKRSGTSCPTRYAACSGLGAPGLCCAATAVCSADAAGHVACCPTGAACSGTIGSIITAGTLGGSPASAVAPQSTSTGAGAGLLGGASTGSGGSSTAGGQQTSGAGLVLASSTAGGGSATSAMGSGFVLDSGTPVATLGSSAARKVTVVSLNNPLIDVGELDAC